MKENSFFLFLFFSNLAMLSKQIPNSIHTCASYPELPTDKSTRIYLGSFFGGCNSIVADLDPGFDVQIQIRMKMKQNSDTLDLKKIYHMYILYPPGYISFLNIRMNLLNSDIFK